MKIRYSVFARILTGCMVGVAVLVTAFFFITLFRVNILPGKYYVPLGAVFVIVIGGIFMCLRKLKLSFRCVLGSLICYLYIIVLVFISGTMMKATSAVKNVTRTTQEINQMEVYVRSDDAATRIEQIAEYRFGVLLVQNREATDKALDRIEIAAGVSLDLYGYSSPAALVQALLENQVDAVVINSQYIFILSELEGMEELGNKIREIASYEVVIERKEIVTVEESGDAKENDTGSDVEEMNIPKVVSSVDGNTRILYLSGIDTYGPASITSRSDVNILVIANMTTHQLAIISTPRDYYVTLPNSEGNYDKLTHAGIYGVDVSVGALEHLYDIRIDNYVKVNFSGFEGIVDALGGVTIENDVAFTAYHGGYFYDQGTITLNGEEALGYVRERYSFLDADYTRARHQMMLVQSIVRKCMSPEMLTHFSEFLNAVDGCFETDLSYETISEFVKKQIDVGGEWDIITYNVSGTGDTLVCWSLGQAASVQVPVQSTIDAAKELIRQVVEGEIAIKPE